MHVETQQTAIRAGPSKLKKHFPHPKKHTKNYNLNPKGLTWPGSVQEEVYAVRSSSKVQPYGVLLELESFRTRRSLQFS